MSSGIQSFSTLAALASEYASDDNDDEEDIEVECEASNSDIARAIIGDCIAKAVSSTQVGNRITTSAVYRSEAALTDDSDLESSSSGDESEADDSDCSSSSSSSSGDAAAAPESMPVAAKAKKSEPRTKGEFLTKDLPPIEDLQISVATEECVQLGTISSIVEDLVVVKAFPNTAAIDLDSVLFLDVGVRSLGRVFDVFGPVTEPYYSVRFNSTEHIASRDIAVGMAVFCAPRTSHTSFVFVEQLRRLKGTDASWKHDEEAPSELLDFSDDEEERAARRKRNPRLSSEGQQSGSFQFSNSPFYRRTKHFDPRANGPIRWNSLQNAPPPPAYNQYASNSMIRPPSLASPMHSNQFSRPPPPISCDARNPYLSNQGSGFPLPNPFSSQSVMYNNLAFRLPPPPPPPPST